MSDSNTIDTSSDLGKTFIEYSSRGELVPDDVTVKMWQQNMHARTALSEARFSPAVQNGRRVRQVVVLPFRFAPPGRSDAERRPPQ